MPLGNASRTANILEHRTPRCSNVSNTPSSSNSFAAHRDSSIHSGCSKHMTENLKLLTNFVEKFLGTVKFGNDQLAPILGYGDLVQGTITIKRDGENLDKMKEKGDACIFVGYSTQSKAYSTQIILTLVAMDVKTSFLYGPLKEEVLKQAPRAWYDELSNFLVSEGFLKGSIDPTLFITKHREDILLVQIYVDDIIFGSTNPKLSKQFGKLMHSKFDMSNDGELKFFLGIRSTTPHGIFINQAKYAQEILKKHGMTSCDSIGTPMATKHLDADLSGTPVDQTKYRSMVRALMYLTASRLDILHATCYCARYQAKPTEKHLTTVEKGIVELFFVGTEYQLADMFTKALPEDSEDGNPAWATSYKILVGDFAQFLYELKLFDNWISILVTVNELRLNQKDSKLSDSLYRVVCFETFRIRRRWLQPYSSEVGFINHMLILKLSKSIVQHQDG
ncbi:retrovirus-related pol polyprotein from transposon TNT 1-94 [Tanacetum coccineum]|uniref:Retrovirus-related pol polyprotein from transposon TNT 1-94 n=1 Tax=Tanacetum coccineum TaxID=301880 RepID=A0ABQ4ZNK7_9ASTR